MRGMADCSVDAVVTDPPYGLSFMGRTWDYDVPKVEVWREVLRVLKPGGHVLSFAGSRTHHRMAVNIEDAGFDLRDTLMWVYGSGFPKSHDVSKAIDKAAKAEREVVRPRIRLGDNKPYIHRHPEDHIFSGKETEDGYRKVTAPATEAAHQWEGWGSALKPAFEPITLARKPLQGTIAQNVQEWGTGALNIDGCRVETDELKGKVYNNKGDALSWGGTYGKGTVMGNPSGRWPANVIHDGSEEVVGCFPETVSGVMKAGTKRNQGGGYHGGFPEIVTQYDTVGDSGSAARFFKQCLDTDPEDAETRRLFYCGKATKRDRDEGLEGFEERQTGKWNSGGIGERRKQAGQELSRNTHPTVKPTDLMRYLCRLICPPGGIILDPFTGSGSTGKAAILEGFGFIGIEQEPEYVAIANARIAAAAARSEKATLEQRVAWLETQTQALGAKVRRLEASQQLSLWGTP